MKDRASVNHALRRGALVFGISALCVAVATPLATAGATTVRTSVKGAAVQANGRSLEPSISATGRYVAFQSAASNLVAGDTNGLDDCFVRDHANKRTVIVSLSSSGARGNGGCWGPVISGSGRFVAFESQASNLVPGDTNQREDVLVRDLVNRTTERVSVSSTGNQGDGDSLDPVISRDGRFVVFKSYATTLVDDDTNGVEDIFVRDRRNGVTKRVSVGSAGQANGSSSDPSISANGRFVVFTSTATNLVSGDTNGKQDIFIHDLATGKTTRVSIGSNGAQARGNSENPMVSGTGRFVVFDSFAPNLVKRDTNRVPDVFVHDRRYKKTRRVSVGPGGRQAKGWSFDPTISTSGRYIAFTSSAPNLVRRDTNRSWDGFVYDQAKKKTERVSVRRRGGQAKGGNSEEFSISANGRWVTFTSNARNLVRNDTNRKADIFRRGSLY